MLIDFYGSECPHCHNMEPLVAQLEKEANVEVLRIEVWHNDENAKKMESYDKGRCGGVPFFMNTDTGAMICGEVPYEDLGAWAGVK